MTVVYGLVGVITSIAFILRCYEKTTGTQFSKIQKMILSGLHVLFAYLMASVAPNFLLIISAIGFIAGMIYLIKKSVNLIAVTLEVIINQAVWLFVATLIGSIVIEMLDINFGIAKRC